jgi:hypothetical protein
MTSSYIPVNEPNCPKYLKDLQNAYTSLMKQEEANGYDGDIQLAEAIDHVGGAIRSLGYEPKD